jgi:hypothetical protein
VKTDWKPPGRGACGGPFIKRLKLLIILNLNAFL